LPCHKIFGGKVRIMESGTMAAETTGTT